MNNKIRNKTQIAIRPFHQGSDLPSIQHNILLLNGLWEYFDPRKKTWRNMRIPNNWHTGGLHNHKGKILFRRYFTHNNLKNNKQYWLRFYGVDYEVKIRVNGKSIGTHEGYFQPFEFNITGVLKSGTNLLIAEVDSCPESAKDWPENKRRIKGVFGHHDIRPGGWHPLYGQNDSTGGIWNNVEIEETGNERIKGVNAFAKLSKDYKLAKITFKIEIQTTGGPSTIKRDIYIKNPKLWWTWDHGRPNLYKIKIRRGESAKEIIFGIREIKFDKNSLFLNGRKIFIRGSNIIPEEYLSQYTESRIKKDVSLARAANINALRIHAHVNRREFYDECDRAGILVWQDFPLQWEYADNFKMIKNARAQIQDMVSLLCNHPSIFFWCCHNEPLKSRKRMDPVLTQAVKKIDTTRPVITNSDFREHPYPGWFVGDMGHFISLPGKPLVTEFGAQALPGITTLRKIFSKKDLWPPNWQEWSYRNFIYEPTFNIAQVKTGKTLKEFINNSQNYQSDLIKTAIENYRAHKFTEISGLFHFMFADPWPCISYSVLDYYRRPKKGFNTLRNVYQPLLLIYHPERKTYTIGDSVRGMFYLVNDYPHGFKNALLTIRLGNFKYPAKRINIAPNSRIIANKIVYPLPLHKKLKPGKYNLLLEIKDKGGRIISVNNCTISLNRIPEGLLEYNAVFKWE